MIRTLLFTVILLSALTVKAQTPFSYDPGYGLQPVWSHPQQLADTNSTQKKWFVTKYGGISTGFIASGSGSGTFLSVPLALQLNRQLNNNLFAFGNVSTTPYLFNANSTFTQPVTGKGNSLMQVKNFGNTTTARVGLMFTNNERTFSISGSIGVSRSTYNGYSPFYAPMTFPVQ